MTPQEKDQLSRFLEQLVNVRIPGHDQEADAMIRQAAAQQPDALYLLVQKALIQQQALEAAQARINQLESQTAGNHSFLGGGQPAYTPQYMPAPQSAAPAAPTPGPSPWGSTLGTIATTAAGVAAGEFLFEGLSGMFGHHSGGFFGQQGMTENVTVNNFYDNSGDPGYQDSGFNDPGMLDPGFNDPGDDGSWT